MGDSFQLRVVTGFWNWCDTCCLPIDWNVTLSNCLTKYGSHSRCDTTGSTFYHKTSDVVRSSGTVTLTPTSRSYSFCDSYSKAVMKQIEKFLF